MCRNNSVNRRTKPQIKDILSLNLSKILEIELSSDEGKINLAGGVLLFMFFMATLLTTSFQIKFERVNGKTDFCFYLNNSTFGDKLFLLVLFLGILAYFIYCVRFVITKQKEIEMKKGIQK